MASTGSTATRGGMSIFGWVFIVFLVLKLAEIGQVATWSWWWVTAPIWIPFGIGLIICIFMVAVYILALIVRSIVRFFDKN